MLVAHPIRMPTERAASPPAASPAKADQAGASGDANDYYCAVCIDGGALVACDGTCFRSFHVARASAPAHPPPCLTA
jgi:hypothetical protein